MASPIRGRSCITTRPAPMLRWPTSELPICPGGRPTSRPEVRRNACGPVAHSRSNVGVLACRTALSAASSRQPQPSSTTSITGRRFCMRSRSLPEKSEGVLGDQGAIVNRRRNVRRRPLRRHRAGLPAEHGALAGDAPVIAGELAGLAETRWQGTTKRDRVLADRGADRARGLRLADRCRRCRNRWWRGPSGCAAASPTPAPRNRCRSAPRAAAGPARQSFLSKMRAASGAVRALSST